MSHDLTPEQVEEKKKRNAILWADIQPEELERELFGNIFSDYLADTMRGHSKPDTPIKIFYALKHFSEYTLPSSRLVTLRNIVLKSGVNEQLLRRHIHNFVIAGFCTEHRTRVHLTGTKKETSYQIKQQAEWNKDWFVDLHNHIMILREIAKQ